MSSSSSSPLDAQRYDLSKRPESRRINTIQPSSSTLHSEDSKSVSFKTESPSVSEPLLGQKTSNYLQALFPILTKNHSKSLRDALYGACRISPAQNFASENYSGDGDSSHTTIRVILPRKSFNVLSSCMSIPCASLDAVDCIRADHFDQERVIQEWCEKEIKGEDPASIEVRYDQVKTRCHFTPESCTSPES
ncbi:hypothetical protein HYPSUDRAFT_56046 [Hypholoma sublateritium FD-334 SS-4]|uniref:Uncharacterized protein n=1 Tax=Hypholoma sublateritium (strain FD-334 SS-4) TaxID=945553 RepID=A0A0D2NNM8_HYPSF|nr:hypothetical protein HYPSUDRAFT_56046 [Hypholoma sublateritium FD-334 SS-4]